LNKDEAQNVPKRTIFFHRTSRIRDRDLQAQAHCVSALNLFAGAIVLWNTTPLEAGDRLENVRNRTLSPDRPDWDRIRECPGRGEDAPAALSWSGWKAYAVANTP